MYHVSAQYVDERMINVQYYHYDDDDDDDVEFVPDQCFAHLNSVSSSFFFRIVLNFNILKVLTLLVHADIFGCFLSPPISDVDRRIFNVRMSSFYAK